MTTELRVSVGDVGNLLGVAEDFVYRWMETRGLPAHKNGRLWRSELTQVDAWVEAGATNEVPADGTQKGGGEE